jgi:hypothetical protein
MSEHKKVIFIKFFMERPKIFLLFFINGKGNQMQSSEEVFMIAKREK